MDKHEAMFDALRLQGSGLSPYDATVPPKPRYKMNPALQGHVRGGLADTLATIVGRPGYVIDTIPDFVKEPGLLGHYPPPRDTVQVGMHMAGGDLSQDIVNETVIHETGHLLSYLSSSFPELTRMRKKGDNEGAAQAFLRAFLGLQATQNDTTNAEGVLQQFGLGIAPSLSRVEHNRGTVAEAPMHRVINELLGQPIFAKHPLQSRLRDFIQEWGK